MPISADLQRALARNSKLVILESKGDASKPDYESASYRRQIGDVLFCRTVYDGTKAVRDAGDALLPQYPSEDDEDYQRRLKRAVLFNAFKRTAHGLVGMIYRKDPQWKDTPPERTAVESLNVDLLGHDINVFARDRSIDAMIDGHTWVLVDYPRVEVQLQSQADEREQGLRPYWVPILKSQAINVQWEVGPDGRPRLTLFAYKTVKTDREGAFGEEEKECIRVLEPGGFTEYERTKSGWVEVDQGASTLPYIPVAFIPSNETMPYESTPPLLDVAFENIDHYQIRSDHRWAGMFASQPMPVFTGAEPEQIVWGAGRALFLPNPEANATLLESSGASLDSTRDDMKDSEARMAALGLQMLVGEKRTAETAQSKLIGKAESDSVLSAMAKAMQDGFNRALAIHADWTGTEPAELALNNDFHETQLDSQTVMALSNLVARGQLSMDTMWSALLAGEVLPDSFDPEEERERIDAAGMDELEALLAMRGNGNGSDE